MERLKNIKIRDKSAVISFILLTAAAAAVVYYMLGPSEGYIHSDCLDTMTWAEAALESGKLFSGTFNYPCLLPGAAFIMIPFMAVFGFTMLAYRLSMLFFMVLLCSAIYFVSRGLGWNKAYSRAAIALELIIVSSSAKLRELFWEHIIYYSLGIFLAFGLLAFVFAFMKHFEANGNSFKIPEVLNKKDKKDKKSKEVHKYEKYSLILALCIFLWAFFAAFNGMTILTLTLMPVGAGLVFAVLFDFKHKIISKENLSACCSVGLIAAATVIGLVILKFVSEGIGAGYSSAYSNIVDKEEWSANLLKFIYQWSSLMGADYETGQAITKGANIIAAVKLAGGFILFLTPAAALFMLPKLNRNERIFIFFHWIMSAFVLYGYIFGSLSSVNWRLSPIVCSSVISSMIVWRAVWVGLNIKRGAVLLASLVAASAAVTAVQIWSMPADYGRDNNLHLAAELLENNGLDYGYATYWNANVLTLISNGKVKSRDIVITEDEPEKGWLNSDSLWYEDQPGRDTYFVLLTESEYDDLSEREADLLYNTREVIQESGWVVLVKDENIF